MPAAASGSRSRRTSTLGKAWNVDVYTTWEFRKRMSLYGRLGYAQTEPQPAYLPGFAATSRGASGRRQLRPRRALRHDVRAWPAARVRALRAPAGRACTGVLAGERPGAARACSSASRSGPANFAGERLRANLHAMPEPFTRRPLASPCTSSISRVCARRSAAAAKRLSVAGARPTRRTRLDALRARGEPLAARAGAGARRSRRGQPRLAEARRVAARRRRSRAAAAGHRRLTRVPSASPPTTSTPAARSRRCAAATARRRGRVVHRHGARRQRRRDRLVDDARALSGHDREGARRDRRGGAGALRHHRRARHPSRRRVAASRPDRAGRGDQRASRRRVRRVPRSSWITSRRGRRSGRRKRTAGRRPLGRRARERRRSGRALGNAKD